MGLIKFLKKALAAILEKLEPKQEMTYEDFVRLEAKKTRRPTDYPS